MATQQATTVPGPDVEKAARKAVASWWKVVQQWPDSPDYHRALALQCLATAEYYRRIDKSDEAALWRREAQRALAPPWSGKTTDCPQLVGAAVKLDDLADSLRRLHRDDDAECLLESVVSIWAYIRTILPRDEESLMRWAMAQGRVAGAYERRRGGAKADEILAAVEVELLRVRDWKTVHADVRITMAEILRQRAVIARDRKDLSSAVALLNRADQHMQDAQKTQIRTAFLRRTEVGVYRVLAGAHRKLNNNDEAFAALKRCRDAYREMLAFEGVKGDAQIHFGRACADAGSLAVELCQSEEAASAFTEALAVFGQIAGTMRVTITDSQAYAESATMLARMQEADGDAEAARSNYELALSLWRRLHVRSPRTRGVKKRLALVESKLGVAADEIRAAPEINASSVEEDPTDPDSEEER